MAALIAGAVVGLLAGVLLGRRRGIGFGVSYGLLVAGLVWAVAGIVAGNRAEEMAAIPYLVAGGMAFWFVALPAGVAVFILERRRSR